MTWPNQAPAVGLLGNIGNSLYKSRQGAVPKAFLVLRVRKNSVSVKIGVVSRAGGRFGEEEIGFRKVRCQQFSRRFARLPCGAQFVNKTSRTSLPAKPVEGRVAANADSR